MVQQGVLSNSHWSVILVCFLDLNKLLDDVPINMSLLMEVVKIYVVSNFHDVFFEEYGLTPKRIVELSI